MGVSRGRSLELIGVESRASEEASARGCRTSVRDRGAAGRGAGRVRAGLGAPFPGGAGLLLCGASQLGRQMGEGSSPAGGVRAECRV